MARRSRGQFPRPKLIKGSWKIWFRDHSGRQSSRVLGHDIEIDYAEAFRRAQAFIAPINGGVVWTLHTDKTLGDLTKAWRNSVKPHLKHSTGINYEGAIKHLLKEFGDRRRCQDLDGYAFQKFLSAYALSHAPYSVATLRNTLQGLFANALRWGWVTANPLKGKFVLPRVERVRPVRLVTPEEAKVWLAEMPFPLRAVVGLALYTGLRKGELEALLWQDWQEDVIPVTKAIYNKVIDTPKSRCGNRKVAVPSRARELLAEWRVLCGHTKPTDPLFATKCGKPFLLASGGLYLRRLAKAKSLPYLGWHDMRRTYTTWGRQAGVPAEAMRDQLGHSSIQMTLDVYSQIDNQTTDVTGMIDRMVSGGTTKEKIE